MHRFLLLTPLFLLPAGQAAAVPGEKRVASSSELTIFLNSGLITYSDASYSGLEALRKGHADTAYALCVQEGLQGDIDALPLAGMLCKMEEKKQRGEEDTFRARRSVSASAGLPRARAILGRQPHHHAGRRRSRLPLGPLRHGADGV